MNCSRAAEHDLELTRDEVDLARTKSIVNQINRTLIAFLAGTAPHLKTCQVCSFSGLA